MHLLPLGNSRNAGFPTAVAAIFVAQPEATFVPPTRLAVALFDLTPAEGRVFGAIASGQALAETAVALGVARSTVKTHLHRLYEKIGVRRQAELVQVARSLHLPVATA